MVTELPPPRTIPRGAPTDPQLWHALDHLLRTEGTRHEQTDLTFGGAASPQAPLETWHQEVENISKLMSKVMRDYSSATKSADGSNELGVEQLWLNARAAFEAGLKVDSVRPIQIMTYLQPWHMAVVALLYSWELSDADRRWSVRCEPADPAAKIIMVNRPRRERRHDRRHARQGAAMTQWQPRG